MKHLSNVNKFTIGLLYDHYGIKFEMVGRTAYFYCSPDGRNWIKVLEYGKVNIHGSISIEQLTAVARLIDQGPV